MHILLIEDDQSVAEFVEKGFIGKGQVITHAATGTDGLGLAKDEAYDAIIIDRMLPELDGISIVKALRGEGDTTPILILSALGEVSDRIDGLKVGADDYLAKPFDFEELYTRIEVLVRRRDIDSPVTRLKVADLELDLLAHEVQRAGQKLSLQPREFRLLEYLMRNAGQIVTRTMLLENVWDYHFDPQTNVIDVHVSRLRQKIDKDFDRPLLQTVRGSGYVLNTPS
ncbi:MAG TPA: DNA-binding response regulator [Cellvibrionales bacterium]|jgi:two-component system OmpR family response regulator|nr:DNA-binding response regulator [Cellvibrionales bacterium]HAW14208.1 DNA-binding response regulator [Cellvibrionales bacterium]HCX26187.1 DNA-binding response regulator [Cellvibrionales bacterium]